MSRGSDGSSAASRHRPQPRLARSERKDDAGPRHSVFGSTVPKDVALSGGGGGSQATLRGGERRHAAKRGVAPNGDGPKPTPTPAGTTTTTTTLHTLRITKGIHCRVAHSRQSAVPSWCSRTRGGRSCGCPSPGWFPSGARKRCTYHHARCSYTLRILRSISKALPTELQPTRLDQEKELTTIEGQQKYTTPPPHSTTLPSSPTSVSFVLPP